MSKKILVTDSLFVFDEHVKLIEEAGYEVVRLDNPEATEDELCKAIVNKVGYILGGTEKVTDKVIAAANKLKVISFTGAGFTEYVPGFEAARKRGISITAAIGRNAEAVSEFAMIYILMATRRVPQLTNPNGDNFRTTNGAGESVLGVVGYGHIGKKVARTANLLGYSVLVCGRGEITGLTTDIRQVDIDTLCRESDIISIHVDKINGLDVLNKDRISMLKNGAAVVNVAFTEAMDVNEILKRAYNKEISIFTDQKVEYDSNLMPSGYLVQTNSQSGYNTFAALREVSDQTVSSLLNILNNDKDEFKVV